jgi:hypothetical protein
MPSRVATDRLLKTSAASRPETYAPVGDFGVGDHKSKVTNKKCKQENKKKKKK